MKPHHKVPRSAADSFRPSIGDSNGNSSLTDDLYENDAYHKIQMQKSYARGQCGGIEKYEDHSETMLKSLGLDKADIYQQKVLGTFSLETPLIGHEGFRGPANMRSRGPGNMMEHMCGQQKVDKVEHLTLGQTNTGIRRMLKGKDPNTSKRDEGRRKCRERFGDFNASDSDSGSDSGSECSFEGFEDFDYKSNNAGSHSAVDAAINQMYHGFSLEDQDEPCLTRTENLRGGRHMPKPKPPPKPKDERLLKDRKNHLPNDHDLLNQSTGNKRNQDQGWVSGKDANLMDQLRSIALYVKKNPNSFIDRDALSHVRRGLENGKLNPKLHSVLEVVLERLFKTTPPSMAEHDVNRLLHEFLKQARQ